MEDGIADARQSRELVQSVQRALDVLFAFSADRPALSVAELAR